MLPQPSLQNYLHKVFVSKRERNPSFSLRSFAKLIGTSPGTASDILAGKRRLTLTRAQEIAEKLRLDPTERCQLLSDFSHQRSRHSKNDLDHEQGNYEVSSDTIDHLKIAEEKILETPVQLRDFSNYTFPVNVEKFAEAVNVLNRLETDLAELLNDKPSEVYQLSVYFYALTKGSRQ